MKMKLGQFIVSMALAVFFMWMAGCVLSTTTKYPEPTQAPSLNLYTPEGYNLTFWIFEEYDGSCVFEYSILDRNKVVLGHGKSPCEMLYYFFHAIQPRPKTT